MLSCCHGGSKGCVLEQPVVCHVASGPTTSVFPHPFRSSKALWKGPVAHVVAARRVAGHAWWMRGGHCGDCKRHVVVAPGVENTASRFRFANSDRATAVPCPERVSTWPTVRTLVKVASQLRSVV